MDAAGSREADVSKIADSGRQGAEASGAAIEIADCRFIVIEALWGFQSSIAISVSTVIPCSST
jgi:hypothetical protein